MAQQKSAALAFVPILIGGVLGIFTGVFLGDYAAVFRPIGQIYVMLLEVAVYPYLVASLMHGLASLSPERAWRLLRNGWPFYLYLFGVTFGMLALFSLAIPAPRPSTLATSSGSLSALVGPLINILVPSDFIAALSQNSVPAVVLFCIGFGAALQKVKEKQALLSVLDSIRAAAFAFWSFVVRMVPVAIFALMADTAGTIQVQSLKSIGLFMVLFLAGIFILAFWIIPGSLQALTPLRVGEVFRDMRSALILALITTLPASAIPFVMEATTKLAARCGVDDPERDEVAQAHLSIAYPLGQCGNFFVYFFIFFAAFLYAKAIPLIDQLFLPIMTLLSCFGTPVSSVNAVTFIGHAFHFPSSVTDLFVELQTILRYGQVVASVMGYAFLSFTVVLAYYGKIRVRWTSLLGVLGSAAVVVLVMAWGANMFYTKYGSDGPNPYLSFTLDAATTKGVAASYVMPGEATELVPGESVLDRITRTGTLRVGYNDGVIPFCYRNTAGELVGFDVAFAYRLARDLNVKLQFVPYEWGSVDERLKEGAFDLAIGGIYVTRERLVQEGVSNPYFQSQLAFFTLRHRGAEFLSRAKLMERHDLRIGVFSDSVLIPTLKNALPNAQEVIVADYAVVPDFSKVDGAFWSLTQSDALAAAHPDLIAVPTSDLGSPFLFAYLTPPHQEDFMRLINYSLEASKTSGFGQAQTDYWIKRLPRLDKTPRWSILRNVLGVGEVLPSRTP